MHLFFRSWLPSLGGLTFLLISAFSTHGAETSPAEAAGRAASPKVVQMLPGITEPTQQVTLAAPVDGVLMTMHVREDAPVHSGDVLAVMDNRIQQAAVELAQALAAHQAGVLRAKNELKMAQRYLERVTQAAEAASELELDNAQGNVEQARVSLRDALDKTEAASLELELEQARLATLELRAPFDGRILEVDGKVGQSMTRADAVLTLASLKDLCVELHVPVAWYGKLTPGKTYKLLAAKPVGKILPATLVAVQPVIDAATQTFRCVFEIDNSDEQLPAGFAVRLVQPNSDDSTLADTKRPANVNNPEDTATGFGAAPARAVTNNRMAPLGGR